ncbi:hypothetical protein N657DRAFT_319870 [Parathielavia appendiculata]|uniref:Uncharacterized protein n=1 Tax=Parathielavia appendiculata TaxID=2587402 RepID=A0AAN6TRM8_9PEZI|nr:hypothetical protein N657DRAFT_319870 [Parathielavia appendiculata]
MQNRVIFAAGLILSADVRESGPRCYLFCWTKCASLYLVQQQDPEREKECTSDIYIVQGLRGGATESWQQPESGVIWFQHLLPNHIRHQTNADSARIWTFGYDAGLTFQAATVYKLSLILLNRVKAVRQGQEVKSTHASTNVCIL